MNRLHAWRLAAACVLAARALSSQETVPPDRARVADAVRADLSKLSELERAYFSSNKHFTTDIKVLHFVPASGATIAVSYASARTFSASASHARLLPFLCFVIVSSADARSPAERPFCTDSRYGTAATALARAGTEPEVPLTPVPRRTGASARPGVTPVTVGAADRPPPKPAEPLAVPPTLTPAEFAERLRAAAASGTDSIVVSVQFAVKDARYDPSRGVLEIAVEPVPLPLLARPAGDTGARRLALACFTRPAFLCGESGLTYIARDLLHVPKSRAPDPDVLRSGLSLQARFAVGRRDDARGPALTLLALLLQAKGEVVARWEASTAH
jgi:hypothetical protein